MRNRLGSALVALVVASHASLAGLPVPQPGAEPMDLFPDGEVIEPPELPAEGETTTLPAPSLVEPFAIGEALYDPAGVADAVVSLLARMGVPIVADQAAADRAARLTLSEAEARTLVDMGAEDAEAAAESDEGAFPYTFADVHAVVAPFLGDVGVERLAELYAGAYERRPDDLAPGVLMGQPIDSQLSLSRVHVWLLLVDGFVGPGERTATAERGPHAAENRPTYAILRRGDLHAAAIPAAAPAARWGSAQSALRSLANRLQNVADLPWIAAHLPLIASRVPLVITPSRATAHEGHGGPGRRVGFEGRIGAPAAPVVAPSGRPVLVPRASPNLAGREMIWNLHPDDQDRFDNHGTLQGTVNSWVRSNASGAIPLAYLPRRENANGRGSLNKENANLRLQMKTWDLLTSRFELAPEFQGVQSQIRGLTKATAPVRLEWHSDGLELELTSIFDVALNLGALGKTHRWGYEGIRGSLAERADGSFRGVVRGRTVTAHIGGGLGKVCPEAESFGTQWLEATATPVTRLNVSQDRNSWRVTQGQPDGGYFKLTFKPVSEPVFTQSDACQDAKELLRQETPTSVRLLPFNDARWHTPEHSWIIALPKREKLVYFDDSHAEEPPPPPGFIGPADARKDLGPWKVIITKHHTSLKVEAERTDQP